MIAGELRQEILRGELRDMLPAEAALMERFGVARATLRQATGLLASEGLIESRQGRRTRIRPVPPIRHVTGARFARLRDGLGPYLAEAADGGWEPTVEMIEVGKRQATPLVAKRLGLEEGEMVLMRHRRYLADGFPMQVATSFVPWALTTDAMTGQETGPGGIYARLEEQGHRIAGFKEEVSSGAASGSDAQALQIPPRSPVLVVRRVAYADGGLALELCDTVMVGSRAVLEYELKRT